MQTDSYSADGVPSNNFTVARVRQDFENRSNIGVMFVNRSGTGEFSPNNDHNQSYAVDGRLGIGQAGTISGFVANTHTGTPGGLDVPDINRDAHAYDLSGQ